MPSLSSRLHYIRSKKMTILNAGCNSPYYTSKRHAHNAHSLESCRRLLLSWSLHKKTASHYYHITLNSQIGRREKCWHLFLSPICYEQRRALHLENIKGNAAPKASSSVQETTTATHKSKEENETEFSVQSESFVFDYSPQPPRPASYVPPDKRDVSDPSLDYISSDNPLHKIIKEKREFEKKSFSLSPSVNLSTSLSDHMREKNSEIVLEEGQMLAPSPKPPTWPTVHYIDRHAERLHSTSVRGGHSLLDRHTGIDTGELYFARNDKYSNTSNRNEESSEETTSSLTTAKPYVNVDKSFHMHNLRKDGNTDNIITTNTNKNRSNNIDKIEESRTTKKYDVNGAVIDNLEQNEAYAHKNVEADHVYPFLTKTQPEIPDIDAVTFLGLEEDKSSWYQPIFDSQSQKYKSNAHGTVYGRGDMYERKPLFLSMQEEEMTTNNTNIANGIASQNIIKLDTNKLERDESLEVGEESIHVQRQREMQNRRMRWQNRLFSYSPEKAPVLPSPARHVSATLINEKTLEENRNKELRGYAFPPSSELANLKSSDRMQWLYALEKTRHEKTLFDKMRQTYGKLRGKSHDQDEYVVTEGANLVEDTSLWYRHFNIDAIQRRQLRYMFTDNDYGNITTALHVMHTYPYTNILYLIIVMLSIWLLYKLQIYFNALEFYDDYLGIDLTLTPDLKKPLLGTMAFIVGVFYLSYPTCLLSIGITRAYRILLRRPIGPP